MRRSLILILSLIVLLSAAGCAAATPRNNLPATTTAATTTAAYDFAKEGNGAGAGDAKDTERKIVRNATLDLEVKDVKASYDELLAFAAERGGYEVRRLQQSRDGYITIDAQIKIKPDQLDPFLLFAATMGTVINTETTSEDITENYYDAQIRLGTMEKSLDVYYGFLEKASTVEDILRVQNEINQLTTEIESLKGRLKLWDSLLAESVITLRLRQTEDPVKMKKEINWSTLSWDDMAYLMQSGLTKLVNFLVSALQWLAIIVVVTTPLWLIALIVLFFVIRKKRRNQRQLKAALVQSGIPQEQAAPAPGKEDKIE
jgi:hypothetical protein